MFWINIFWLMSWIKDKLTLLFQRFCIRMVKFGRVPDHVAVIMDGSRRFARKHVGNPCGGYQMGFQRLIDTLDWCIRLGISEVTLYGFSIENFKRSEEEIDFLMNMARDRLAAFFSNQENLRARGVRINIPGRLSLLPNDIQAMACRTMLATRDHDTIKLNLACAYTGSDELSRTTSHLIDGVRRQEISPADIDEALISQAMELGEPQLMIRTSGVCRLSDFMIWQVSNTVLYFTDVMWPEFSVYHFLAAILHFRRNAPNTRTSEILSEKKQKFLANLESRRWEKLKAVAGCS